MTMSVTAGSLHVTDIWRNPHFAGADAGEVLTEMAEYVKGVGRADDDDEAAKVRISLPAYHAIFADLRTTCCMQGPCRWDGRRMVPPHY